MSNRFGVIETVRNGSTHYFVVDRDASNGEGEVVSLHSTWSAAESDAESREEAATR